MITEIYGSFAGLAQKMRWYREFGLDTEMLKMLLRIECAKNRALLRPVLRNSSKIPQDDPIFIHVALLLETEAFEILLGLDDRAAKAFRQLQNISLMKEEVDGSPAVASGTAGDGKPVSTADKLRTLYVNVCAVRSLASVWKDAPECTGRRLQRVHFKTRLRNIERVLSAMEQQLAK